MVPTDIVLTRTMLACSSYGTGEQVQAQHQPDTDDHLQFRMFGTFEAEKSDIKIVYGLVDQPQFWNPLKHQVVIQAFIFVDLRAAFNMA